MVWPPIYSVSLTFAGCPLQLYLLRMFCSSAHRKISFRTWFFQMFFNKSLIKCEKFVSCLMQYSKKYWKWPETYVLILHSYWTPQFQNFCHSSYMFMITLYNSKILLSLHCFLTPQFQTFTNLLIGIFESSNSTQFFLEVERNYASIIVTIISNITALQCYLLWILVSIRRLLQLIVYIGVSISPSKTLPLLFRQAPS